MHLSLKVEEPRLEYVILDISTDTTTQENLRSTMKVKGDCLKIFK